MGEYLVHSRRWGAVFALGYLVFLVQPAFAELTSGRPLVSVLLATAALAAFIALDVYFWVARSYYSSLPGTVAVVAGLCSIAVLLTVHNADWVWLLIYCSVAAGAGTLRRRWAGGMVLTVLALSGLLALADPAVTGSMPTLAIVVVMSGLAMLGIGWMVESNGQLRQAREEVARLAVAEERLRFARDLHDLLGHSLSVIVLKSELAGRLGEASPERAVQEIRDVERVAREALREVREAVAGYRERGGLGQELESARATLGAAGVDVLLEGGASALPASVDSTLAWALREGVTNILRHSRARRARVRVARSHGRVELELLDDGVGCLDFGDGNGLRGLRERAAAREGTVAAGPRPEGGFRLAVSLPLTEACDRMSSPA